MIALRIALGCTLAAVMATLVACGDEDRGETIEIRFSSFGPAVVESRAGEAITITLRNSDPIEHEWLVGDTAMHERHRTGTEAYHDEVPTEVTIPALETRVTTVTFFEPGDYKFICHLPGHEAYGMVGVLRVTDG